MLEEKALPGSRQASGSRPDGERLDRVAVAKHDVPAPGRDVGMEQHPPVAQGPVAHVGGFGERPHPSTWLRAGWATTRARAPTHGPDGHTARDALAQAAYS